MYKKIAFIGIGIALAAVPFISSAQTLTTSASVTISSLQAEIQSLLAELQALESGLGMATSSVFVGATTTPLLQPALPVCPVLTRSLSIGESGQDVTALQEFLSAEGFLNVSATGYFGPLTETAVANWQANVGVASSTSAGAGVFGPLSRGFLSRSCSGSLTNIGIPITIGTSTQGSSPTTGGNTSTGASFSASPSSGVAPLTVQFISTAPQGGSVGASVNFGDGTSGSLAFVPVCSSCQAEGVVSHTYQSSGTYTAQLMGGACSCPANGICNCPNMMILGTASVTVLSVGTSSSEPSIIQLNAPGSATLSPGGIAEIRNESFYFTLESVTSSSATIQTTPVGCWNSFPSDPKPQILCMIATLPIPPQTLLLGQTYTSGNYSIELTSIGDGTATFSISAFSTVQ